MRHYQDIEIWKTVTEEQWNDWKWQVKNRITTIEDLKQVINLTPEEEEGAKKSLEILRMGITPYYATLMDQHDPKCPIRMQAVPTISETYKSEADMDDHCMKTRILQYRA